MKAVLPGLPQAKLQAVCTGLWNDRRLVVGHRDDIFAPNQQRVLIKS